MNSHENLVPAEGYRHVKMHPEARVALNATVIGDVELARDATVLPEAAIRADYGERIVIGEGSDVQEGCSLHVDAGFPLTVGRNVIIGHNATVHGCTVEDGVLIGMGAIVMNGVHVGKEWRSSGPGRWCRGPRGAAPGRHGGRSRQADPHAHRRGGCPERRRCSPVRGDRKADGARRHRCRRSEHAAKHPRHRHRVSSPTPQQHACG